MQLAVLDEVLDRHRYVNNQGVVRVEQLLVHGQVQRAVPCAQDDEACATRMYCLGIPNVDSLPGPLVAVYSGGNHSMSTGASYTP
jgi:hypothetical protein